MLLVLLSERVQNLVLNEYLNEGNQYNFLRIKVYLSREKHGRFMFLYPIPCPKNFTFPFRSF